MTDGALRSRCSPCAFTRSNGIQCTGRNRSSQSTDCVAAHTVSLKSTETLKKERRGDSGTRAEVSISLSRSHQPHLNLLASGLFSEVVFVVFTSALAQQGGHFSGRVWNQSRKGLVLRPLNGLTSHEKERVREKVSEFPPMHIHSLLHLYIQMCIQNINTLSLRNT